MEIRNKDDINTVADVMHDTKFGLNDITYDSKKRIFLLTSQTADIDSPPKEEFRLELYNVDKYIPRNLDKIERGKATGGIFNDIRIKGGKDKLEIILISQDLRIELESAKIEGRLERKEL